MSMDVEIQGPTRICAATGRELKSGERFYGVLLDESGRFVRRDFAPEAWTTPPPGAIAYWSGRIPGTEKPRKPTFNDDLLLDCFTHLANAYEPDRLNFRYVVALLLMRRKRLKFEDAFRDESGRDVLMLRDSRSGTVHNVVDPRLTDEQMTSVQDEVFRVLGWE